MPFLVVQAVDDAADLEAQVFVNLAHPLGVALGQVVVHRDHVYALFRQRIQIHGQGGDQGFALAGLHLGDHAPVEHDAAHELDVEMALSEGALGGLAHGGEGVGQERIQLLAVVQTLS